MSDALDTLSDAALSEVFAVEVGLYSEYVSKEVAEEKHFATSADAVLPFLETRDWLTMKHPGRDYTIQINCHATAGENCFGYAPTFARAACIALILAKRAEKGGAS